MHLATVNHPDMMEEADLREKHGHVRVRIGQDRMVHWEVVSRKVDRLEQILEQEVRYTYRVIDGRVLRSDIAIYRFSWLTRREARHLFARCGLKIIAEYADFNGSPPRPDRITSSSLGRRVARDPSGGQPRATGLATATGRWSRQRPNDTKTAGPGAPGSARSGVPVNAGSLRRREPSHR